MLIVNTLDKAIGKWTKTDEETKSILDYIITKRDDEKDIKQFYIDKEKEIVSFRIVKDRSNVEVETIYSDHNVITMKMNYNKTYQKELEEGK